jgi:predicted nucleic-acid-binding Zn-ribbon protein
MTTKKYPKEKYNPNTKDGIVKWLTDGNSAYKCKKCGKFLNTEKRMITHQTDRVNKYDNSKTIESTCKNSGWDEITE